MGRDVTEVVFFGGSTWRRSRATQQRSVYCVCASAPLFIRSRRLLTTYAGFLAGGVAVLCELQLPV